VRYFGNPTSEKAVHDAMTSGLLGCIITPKQGNLVPADAIYCADNGAYGKGYPGDSAWWAWLQRSVARWGADRCAFAVAPDVPFDAAGTLDKSLEWLPRIQSLGVPAALAFQDGIEDLPIPWDVVDVMFIAGSTEWKLGPAARALVTEAKARGKWVHMGRVNSERRFGYAELIGCDSADGTYLTFGPRKNLPYVNRWSSSLFGEVTA
jgi:hypothetical protein